MAIKPWLCFAAVLCPLPWSFSAISQADRDARIHGHFPDVDVLRVDWRTRPLAAQIPVPWLARKVHNWSARKIVAKLGAVEFFCLFFFSIETNTCEQEMGEVMWNLFFALGGSHANLESKEEERSSIISRFLQIFDSSDLVAEGFLGISLGYPKVCPRGCPRRHQTTKAAAPANSSTTLHARLSAYAAGVWLSVSWQVEGVFQAAQESR